MDKAVSEELKEAQQTIKQVRNGQRVSHRDIADQAAFDLLYGFHLSRDMETDLPVKELDGNLPLVSEFMKVFLLFSQIILEDYAEAVAADMASDFVAGLYTPGP